MGWRGKDAPGWTAWIYSAALLGLSALAGWGLLPEGLWALSMQRYLPLAARVALLAAAALMLTPPLGTRLIAALQRASERCARQPLKGLPLLDLLGLGLLLALLSHKPYYGLLLAINDLERAYPTNLLSNIFLQLVELLLGGLALAAPLCDPRDPLIALASLAAGALLIPVLWGLADETAQGAERGPAFALLLFSPALALFAGHREIYCVPALGMALLCWALLSDLRADRPPWRTILAACAALGAHALNVAVLPALTLATLLCGRRAAWPRRLAAAAAPFLAGGLLLLAWAVLKDAGRGEPLGPYELYGSFAHLQAESYGLFWIQAIDPQAPAGFFSSAHLIELFNQLLFHAPQLGLILLLLPAALIKRRGGRATAALAVLWLAALIVAAVDRPIGGHLSQWAHGGGFAVASDALLAWLWWRCYEGDRRPAGSTALIALLGLHTLGFMLLNALNAGPYLGPSTGCP